jgi:peptidyl-prolyl cis-trans isomerase SurA
MRLLLLTLSRVLAAACLAVLPAACRSTAAPAAAPVPPDTWAVVDGKAITQDAVEKAYRRSSGGTQTLSDDEVLAAKLSVLNELVLQEILVAKAAALKVDVPAAELDAAYNDAKKNIPDAAFQQELTKRQLTAADMREGVRRDLLTKKVLEQEINSKISVSDRDVTDFFNANRAQFNMPEESYRIAQIVVTPVREAQISNGSGDDATTPQEAAAKIQMLTERLKSGTPFQELAAQYSEDAESAPRGGDLGFVPVSRLRQAPPQLRDAVLNKPAGTLNVVSAGGGHTIVLVVGHEQAGQRDLSTPGVRDRITETLRARKEQLMRAAYLMAVRSEAVVVNYIARRVLDSKTKAAAPAAPLAPGQPKN